MKKRIVLVALCLILGFSLSGCGPEKLISLTDSERNQIVSFTAHLIGEFNRPMSEGYTSLSYGQLKSINDSLRKENEPEIPDTPDEPDNSDNNNDNGGGGSGDNTTDGGTITFTELVNSNGIEATYEGYLVQDDYVYNGAVAANPPQDPNNTYIILKVLLKNNTTNDILCDIFSNALKLTLSINNKSTVVNATATILPNDFINYIDLIDAGSSVETLIFFEVNKDVANSVSNLTLVSTKDRISKTITIK